MIKGLILIFTLAACAKSTAIAADRPTLGWWDADANQGVLSGRQPVPDVHACAKDPTRQYIGELFRTGINDVQVNYHWAPVVPGPHPAQPTLDQPEVAVAGTLVGADDSTDDVLGDHPYGLDVDGDVKPDPAYAFLAFPSVRPLHTELENRVFPRDALGFTPQAGDRVLMKGAWVLDCGHPPYEAEMHPPSFIGYARAVDATTTIAAAVMIPYRSSLLFNPIRALGTDFNDKTRFGDPNTQPFSLALVANIRQAVFFNDDRLSVHALLVANRFDRLDWTVCAPLPKPADAALDASYRFTTRTGITIRPELHATDGCVRFVAAMGADYSPMPLPHVDADWPWSQLSDSAAGQVGTLVDVRQEIIKALAMNGIDGTKTPALQADHPPRIDAYPALAPRAGASLDTPTVLVTAADDQAYPFYGRVRVRWTVRGAP